MSGKPTALVVEDEEDWIEIFQEALGPYFNVVKAKSVSEVRTILDNNKERIEIALVDILIDVPTKAKVSGLDVMFILNKESIPCIAATSYDDGKTIRDALVIGGAKDVWFKHQDQLLNLREKINLVLETQKKNLDEKKGLFITPSFPTVEGEIDPQLVFVLMPFSEEWSDDVLMLIRTVGEKNRLNVVRADDIFTPHNIVSDIWQSINRAGFIIADITVHNANVFYELGIAHTLGKEVTLIRKGDGQKAPFDISVWRYIEYELTPIKAEAFRSTLSKVFKDYLARHHLR